MKSATLFIGKPGCGKGTQAKILSERIGWPVISSGDLFRNIEKENSVLGNKVKSDLDQGFLMPSWFAIYLFQRSFFSSTTDVIFDGFGRKEDEARLIVEVFSWMERKLQVIHLHVSDDEIVKRLTKRRSISGRMDDYSIEKRLDEYHQYTSPAIEVFRSAGVLADVEGGKPKTIDEVAEEIGTIWDNF